MGRVLEREAAGREIVPAHLLWLWGATGGIGGNCALEIYGPSMALRAVERFEDECEDDGYRYR